MSWGSTQTSPRNPSRHGELACVSLACVSAPASRDIRVPAPLRQSRQGHTFPACDIWSPADTSESKKPPISGQNPVPSWGTGVGVARKRSLRYVPFLFLARFPKEMRCLQSRPLSCLSLLNTSCECIAQFQPNLTAREKLQREFFSCRFCGRKHPNLVEKSAFALWEAGTSRQGPRAAPTLFSPRQSGRTALLPHLSLPTPTPLPAPTFPAPRGTGVRWDPCVSPVCIQRRCRHGPVFPGDLSAGRQQKHDFITRNR